MSAEQGEMGSRRGADLPPTGTSRTEMSRELEHAPTKHEIHAERGAGQTSQIREPHGTAVVGLFHREQAANAAVKALREGGLKDEEISIIAHDSRGGHAGRGAEIGNDRNDSFGLEFDTPTVTAGSGLNQDNYGDGAWSPAAVGGVGGIMASSGLMQIKGLGEIFAAGPLAGVLVGAVGGTIAGGLLSVGVPDERTRYYESRVKDGYVLAVAHTNDGKATDKAREIMLSHGAQDVEIHGSHKH